MGRKRYLKRVHTGPISDIRGGKFFSNLLKQFDTMHLLYLVQAFLRRDSTSLIAKATNLNPKTVKSYFRIFQSRIAQFQRDENKRDESISKSRKVTRSIVADLVQQLKQKHKREVAPKIYFFLTDEGYCIEIFDKSIESTRSLSIRKKNRPFGLIVSLDCSNSFARPIRSYRLIVQLEDIQHKLRIKNMSYLSPKKYGEELLLFLKKFRGIPHERLEDHLLEYEWKQKILKRYYDRPLGTFEEYQLAFFCSAMRNTNPEKQIS